MVHMFCFTKEAQRNRAGEQTHQAGRRCASEGTPVVSEGLGQFKLDFFTDSLRKPYENGGGA